MLALAIRCLILLMEYVVNVPFQSSCSDPPERSCGVLSGVIAGVRLESFRPVNDLAGYFESWKRIHDRGRTL